jgi:PadR family transcriptional regulator, regulatory protein PadR
MSKKEVRETNPTDLTTTQELLMSVLRSKELYGLEIARSISEATDGEYQIPVGSLYPILQRLEKKGYIESYYGNEALEIRGGARRRYYRLTGLGSSVLASVAQLRSNVYAWQPT